MVDRVMSESNENLYVVISLGTGHISGMLARKHHNGRIQPIAQHSTPSNGSIKQGGVHNIDDASRIIDSIIDNLNGYVPNVGQIRSVYVGLECRSMLSRPYVTSLDFGYEEQIITQEHLNELRTQALSVSLPGLEVLDLSKPSYVLDGKRETNPRGVRCRRLEATYQLITVRRSYASNIREVVEGRLSLKLSGIIASPLAEAMMTMSNEELILGGVFINMRAGTTSLSIYHNRLLKGLYVIPAGGYNITKDLMSELKLVEADAERLKLSAGSMQIDGVDKDKKVIGTSSVGGGDRVMMQLTINRIISSRIREILFNVFHLIAESGNEERVGAGVVLAGGVTRTEYFEESLRAMNIPFRIGQIRSEFVDESISPATLKSYATELALLHQATEASVVYEVASLEHLFDEPTETDKSSATTLTPEVEPVSPAEPNSGGYTFEPVNEEEDEEDGDDVNEEDFEEEETAKGKKSSWINRVKNFITMINAGDED